VLCGFGPGGSGSCFAGGTRAVHDLNLFEQADQCRRQRFYRSVPCKFFLFFEQKATVPRENTLIFPLETDKIQELGRVILGVFT